MVALFPNPSQKEETLCCMETTRMIHCHTKHTALKQPFEAVQSCVPETRSAHAG